MEEYCIDCNAIIKTPIDVSDGEIISCPDCGLDYVIEISEDGDKKLKQLTVDGEDWGE